MALVAAVALTLGARAAETGAADLTDLSIEQLLTVDVATASKFPQKITDAPSAVTVITAAEIRRHGHRTLADILATIPGLYVSNDRNYSYVGVRGFAVPGSYNGRLLILVDGFRVNESVYDSAYVEHAGLVDVDLIERVEYVAGPGSALYGNTAFFGVVNIITRDGKAVNGTEAAVAYGSAATREVRATHGTQTRDGLDVLLSVSAMKSRGDDIFFPEFIATNNGIADNLDAEHNSRFFARIGKSGTTFETGYVSRTKGIPTAAFAQIFNAPGAKTVDEQWFMNLRHERRLSDTLQMNASVYAARYSYFGQYVYTALNQDEIESAWWGGELRFLSTAIAGHKLVFGIEYRDDYRRKQLNYDVAPYALFVDDQHDKQSHALFVQDEYRISDTWLLSAGLRHDASSESRRSTSPRLGLIHRWSDRTTLKLLYGEAFRAPNAFELYYTAAGATYILNPALRPETIRTGELVLEHYFRPDFRVTGSVYANRIKDLIQLTTVNISDLMFQNVDAASARGAEVQVERLWPGGTRLRASASYTDTEDESTGARLVNSPRNLLKLNFSTPVPGSEWLASIEAQYLDERLTPVGNTLGSDTIVNLVVTTRRLDKRLDLAVGVYNLFDHNAYSSPSDEHYDSTSTYLLGIPQEGRRYQLKAVYRF